MLCKSTISLAVLLASTSVAAAEATSDSADVTLPQVNVTDSSDHEAARGPVNGYVARKSATATRTDTPLNEIPQSISVISADRVREQNAQTMQEVLRYTAGVHADVYGLDNRGDWFYLRGGSEGSTLLDGLRLPVTGWYGMVRNEPYAFERIEVLRGPSSVMAGQNGPGGVVNLVSKRPLTEAQNEVQMQLGNYNHKQLAVDMTGPLNEDKTLLYRVVALGRDSGTQVDYADMQRVFFAPSLTWRPSSDTSLTAYAEYQKDHSLNTAGFFPLAGTLYPVPNGSRIPLERFVSEPDWDTYGGDRLRLGYELEQKLNDQWTLRHRLRHDHVEGKQRSMYANYWEGFLPDNRSLNRTWYATRDQGRITNADLFLEGKLETGMIKHTLLAGIDVMRQKSSRLYWTDAATPLDVYTPTYGLFVPPVLTPATSQAWASGDTSLDQVGLLLQDQIKLFDRWVVTAALRKDRARTRSNDGSRQHDDALTKTFGVVYLADGGWSPYASYSESFQPEIGLDRLGNPFHPKRGKQLEAGLKWQPTTLPVTASAAVYKLKESGRLTLDPVDINFSVQRGEAEVKGLELEMAATLAQWDVIANYTRTKTEDKDTGFNLPNVPDHAAAVWGVRRLGDWGLAGMKAGLGVRYVGDTWDGGDALKTKSVTLMDAMVSWDIGKWSLALNATNLANKTYFAACLADADCWYGTKREVVFSTSYRW